MMKRSSLRPISQEDLVRERRLGLDVADHHQLDVEQLVDVLADLVGDLADDVGQLLLNAGVDRLADPRRAGRSRAADARAP